MPQDECAPVGSRRAGNGGKKGERVGLAPKPISTIDDNHSKTEYTSNYYLFNRLEFIKAARGLSD